MNSATTTIERPADPSTLLRYYRRHAPLYDWTRWTILHGRRRAVETLNLRPGDRAMEIGCGTGLNLPYLVEAVGAEGSVVGVDFSPDMLMHAARRVSRRGWQNVSLVRADASTLRLPERFDGVLFAYALRVIPKWEAALERAAAHLRPGGRLTVLDFGTFDGWGWPLAPLMRAWLRTRLVETLRDFTPKLAELLDDLEVYQTFGGYYIIATGVRRA